MADEKCFYPERPCIMEDRVKELERWKSGSQKVHEDFYKDQRERADLDGRIDANLETMKTDIAKLVSKQEACEAKPARFMDSLKSNAAWAVLAAFIGFILGGLGL